MVATIKGKKVVYEILGTKGSPVVFVHGWGGSKESLRPLAELVSRTHKSIIIDLPGFGESENPEPEWGTGEYAEVITGLLKSLKLSGVTYFGHSFGGSLGIHLTTSQHDLIRKLILCNSSYRRSVKTSRVAMALKQCAPDHAGLRRFFYRIFFRNSDLARYPQLESNFRRIVTQDLSDRLTKVGAKTLIIWGAIDMITPIGYADELFKKIRNSRRVIVPDAGHSLPLKFPEKVFEIMKRERFI